MNNVTSNAEGIARMLRDEINSAPVMPATVVSDLLDLLVYLLLAMPRSHVLHPSLDRRLSHDHSLRKAFLRQQHLPIEKAIHNKSL